MNSEYLTSKYEDFAEEYLKSIPPEKQRFAEYVVNNYTKDVALPDLLEGIDLTDCTPDKMMQACQYIDDNLKKMEPVSLEAAGVPDFYEAFLEQRRALKWQYFTCELADRLPQNQPFSPALIKKYAPDLHKAMEKSLKVEHPEYEEVIWEKMRNRLPEDLKDLYQPEMLTERQKKKLASELEDVAKKIATGELDSSELKDLIGVFGSAHFTDILYLYFPQFRGVPVETVNGIIGRHLGEFCLLNSKADFSKIDEILDKIPDDLDGNMLERLQKSLLDMAKQSVLDDYNATVKAGGKPDDFGTILNCLDSFAKKVRKSKNESLMQDVLKEAVNYYRSLFELLKRKPEHIVDRLAPGRLFPDLNQLINMKETIDKKQFCNADSMGLGKSANPIFVKEFLNLDSALIVAPSNVIETWKSYLSDKIDSTGKQIGYFKLDQAPQYLEVKSAKDLRRDDLESFDYVLISQEKFNGGYMFKADLINRVLEDTLNNREIIIPILDALHKSPQMIERFLADSYSPQHALTLKRVSKHPVFQSRVKLIKEEFFKNHPSVKSMLVAKLEPQVLLDSGVYQGLQTPLQENILRLSKIESEGYSKKLSDMPFDLRAFDEIHKLKNITRGKRGVASLEMMQKTDVTEYMIALTGTPAPNKASDLAIILKMLYPDDYKKISNEALTEHIINGDILDLRDRLMHKMQMKELEDSVKMPSLEEHAIELIPSKEEQLAYEVLLEEDEVTPIQKIQLLRKFCLNPLLFDPVPCLCSTKLEQIKQDLEKQFMTKQKGVLFVNGFIENVIRGKDREKTILPYLGLPEEEIHVYHGDMSSQERQTVQHRINETDEKGLFPISGQTADVGINLQGADFLMFLNEDWSKPVTAQQIKRVHRYGVKDTVTCNNYYYKGTIEEGVKIYAELKHKAILKILKGIPLAEIEKKMLRDAEKGDTPDLSINQELAETYLSAWLQLGKIWGEIKNMGESRFLDYLEDRGEIYAQSYEKMGRRSYQANNARVTATLLQKIIKADEKTGQDYTILDLASGPEMLKKHALEDLADHIVSLDINPKHFKPESRNNNLVGSFVNLPFQDESVDYCNLGLALHYARLQKSENMYEPFNFLYEANRVLKEGGKVMISNIYSQEFRDEQAFYQVAQKLGFEVVEEFTGVAYNGENKTNFHYDTFGDDVLSDSEELETSNKAKKLKRRFHSAFITLKKCVHIESKEHYRKIIKKLPADLVKGSKFKKSGQQLNNSKNIIEQFTLNDITYDIPLNQGDQYVANEEMAIRELADELIDNSQGVDQIPKDVIVKNGYGRLLLHGNYVLYKELSNKEGIVVVKGPQAKDYETEGEFVEELVDV